MRLEIIKMKNNLDFQGETLKKIVYFNNIFHQNPIFSKHGR